MSEFLADGVELFAGICVRDHARARPWYDALLGGPPTFVAHEKESVWEVAPHRWLVVEERPERAGYAVQTLFVADLDARVAAITGRGLEPTSEEVYGAGVRKVTFRDPDGNEVGFGGNPGADLVVDA
ncbi:VOC family protein [Nocardioides daeguensis]|uniref:VOC domain-containing protein n=1 Tax=Nocardioides daeguensis TaxID=908359 RepID=A0ABP6VZF3_9ACTN|nr:VOC family protein [Nocardioides daeguensis]MBV6726916.1 VOC family protein [Nocardioides daeguensis]MCR1772915.1 VOC family protein [Nocardioides daeguensis]